jgi:F-type H+-transporting ATPase subunit gamma
LNMPSLQDYRRRIRSARNLQQLTKAMKMVSAAKLKRAQDRVLAARPYSATMRRVLSRLAARASNYSHPLLEERKDLHYVVVLMTADKGLCGSFNTNLIKAAEQFLREHYDKKVELITIGRKGRDFFRRRKAPILREYLNLTARTVNYSDAAEIARKLIEDYTAEGSTIDRVFLLYSEFKSVLTQRVTLRQLLPIEAEQLGRERGADLVLIDYLYEQPPAEIFGRLLPRYVETQVYHAMLESVASEHGARMSAMDSASKNAGELIDLLTLEMNRVRQASITREIIEVVSGAQALK